MGNEAPTPPGASPPVEARVTDLSSLQRAVDAVASELGDEYVRDLTAHPRSLRRKIIRDAVWGFWRLESPYLVLVDSPFLQRLRHIFQTALAMHTYPSALHSRFEHSLGTYHVAHRMIQFIDRNCPDQDLPVHNWTEICAAALLHDTGHGPFSHASEDVYGQDPVFNRIRADNKERFGAASPSELLTWCLLHTPTFRELWRVFVDEAVAHHQGDLKSEPSLERVATIICGSQMGLEPTQRAYSRLVNGPFDADKLDYLSRDGYFTGLQTALDVERLLWGLRIGMGPDTHQEEVCVAASHVSALEQVVFNKAQLFAQIYHHHKVRAAATLITRLLTRVREVPEKAGFDLSNPAVFLLLDEYDVLKRGYDPEVDRIVSRIKYRRLPKRALELNPMLINKDAMSKAKLGSLLRSWTADPSGKSVVEMEIASAAGAAPGQVLIDIPPPANLLATGRSLVKVGSDKDLIALDTWFPSESWAHTYNMYRKVAHVFADEHNDAGKIGAASLEWFRKNKVQVSPTALHGLE